MKIGDRVFVHGYIDEIRKDIVIIRNNGGYFGTVPSEVVTGELPSAQPEVLACGEGELIAQPEIARCKDCKYAPKCYGDVLMRSRGGGYIYCPVEYCSAAERRTDAV